MTALTLVLTRPEGQADDWRQRMADQGVPTVSLPLIEISPGPDQAATQAWAALPGAALAFFVSPNAVQYFFAARPLGQAWPINTLAACVGPGSAQALLNCGVPADQIVQPPVDAASLDSEHLWPLLSPLDWQGQKVLLLRGDGGREWLADRLRERGAVTQAFGVYRRHGPVMSAAQRSLLSEILAAPSRHVWLFSSAEGVGHLAHLMQALSPGYNWAPTLCICTHERIADAARALGVGHVVLARPQPLAVQQALLTLQGGPYNDFHCE
ncbi:uroporphyrinogen-III synthase [Paucibacter sp. hw1]|uniref:Uroporphyrinogen-III synthase n=1 Tax=Roseateles koreensis TaxID=2987526 RepID=A0ABT5KPJ3_9BURK|nr:uroporphyrinogen-III synthase [Roseateles koreensis]